jgi:ATP-dependent Clp protease ATP-binding subunit ClpC
VSFIVNRMVHAIANHQFEKARFYSHEEYKARENLHVVREKYNISE